MLGILPWLTGEGKFIAGQIPALIWVLAVQTFTLLMPVLVVQITLLTFEQGTNTTFSGNLNFYFGGSGNTVNKLMIPLMANFKYYNRYNFLH